MPNLDRIGWLSVKNDSISWLFLAAIFWGLKIVPKSGGSWFSTLFPPKYRNRMKQVILGSNRLDFPLSFQAIGPGMWRRNDGHVVCSKQQLCCSFLLKLSNLWDSRIHSIFVAGLGTLGDVHDRRKGRHHSLGLLLCHQVVMMLKLKMCNGVSCWIVLELQDASSTQTSSNILIFWRKTPLSCWPII